MIRHVLASLGLVLAASVMTTSGCAPRSFFVEVTASGVLTLIHSCSNASPKDQAACHLQNHPVVSGDSVKNPLQGKLYLLSPGGEVKASTDCFQLAPENTTDENVLAAAIADDTNSVLEAAMANGLTYSNLKDPDKVVLLLSIYDPFKSRLKCNDTDRIACAALARPTYSSNAPYDIACASCEYGQAIAGTNTGPCRALPGAASSNCFFKLCDTLLAGK